MTQAEYRRLYREAQKKTVSITNETRKIILDVYKEAGELAAKAVTDTTAAGLSDLTSAGWDQISNQLRAGADLISQKIQLETPAAIRKAYKNYSFVDLGYLSDAISSSGTKVLTNEGLVNIAFFIDNALIQATATRVYEDGFTFSDRIWKTFDLNGRPIGVNGDYQYRIKNLILTGQAQGRDNIAIAKDIQLYISEGRQAVFKAGRYGRLVPGAGDYARRITGTVDWRALRIVRSELHASMQTAGRLEGIMNPACMNLYDWKKNSGNPIDPSGARNESGMRCIDLEGGNPYTLETVPGYQHSNCGCRVIPVLMDQREFVSDLKDWEPGGEPEYLNAWYREVYVPGQNNALSF